jgi:antitoxin YefM
VDEASRNLDALIQKVFSDAEPILISTEAGQQIVLMPLDEFNAWKETACLLSNPVHAAHLRKSIARATKSIGLATESNAFYIALPNPAAWPHRSSIRFKRSKADSEVSLTSLGLRFVHALLRALTILRRVIQYFYKPVLRR